MSNMSQASVSKFKRSTVLTTHHIASGNCCNIERQFDLIHDLFVPDRPYAFETNSNFKQRYAYVTHYDEQRIFRVSTDDYSYDETLDLSRDNCDLHNFHSAAQGLLIIQCKSRISHNLLGQLVLDELTGARIEFNEQIRAQNSYLSPDHRYLLSVYTQYDEQFKFTNNQNTTSNSNSNSNSQNLNPNFNIPPTLESTLIVQLVTTDGLKLQYKVRTTLEIIQCAFAWKDGYYAAILLSINRKDSQTEILNLRLLDGRLELMARVPGLPSHAQIPQQVPILQQPQIQPQKTTTVPQPAAQIRSFSSLGKRDSLIVSQKSNLAALNTNKGTFLVDLDDNRIRGQVSRSHESPTLLWVSAS